MHRRSGLLSPFFGALVAPHLLFAHPLEVADFQAGASAESGSHHEVNITVEGDRRIIRSNGIPDHETGRFPNRNNPNSIAPQTHVFSVPANPAANPQPTPFSLQHSFGVALNGVPFDPAAAEFWNRDPRSGWRYEALGGGVNLGVDASNAHVQPTGAYHYHGIPVGLMMKLSGHRPAMVLLGWAADGFPIYGPYGYRDAQNAESGVVEMRSSYRVKSGRRPSGPSGRHDGSMVEDYEFVESLGDLDASNGRYGVTPEFPEGIWHYYLTNDFPFIPRQFKGTPDPSFQKAGGGGGSGGRMRPPGGGRGPGGGPLDGRGPRPPEGPGQGPPPPGGPGGFGPPR